MLLVTYTPYIFLIFRCGLQKNSKKIYTMLSFVRDTNNIQEKHSTLSPSSPNLAMSLLPKDDVARVVNVLEDRAARQIFTERSDQEEEQQQQQQQQQQQTTRRRNNNQEELHHDLLPALRASQSTPNLPTRRQRSSSSSPSRVPSRLGTSGSARSSRWFSSRSGTRGSIEDGTHQQKVLDPTQQLKDLGLQRRTQMLEEQRWKSKKKKMSDTSSSWRNDTSISTKDTPSLQHALSRLTIDKKWTEQYKEEKARFSSAALHNEVRLREVFAATEGMGVPNVQRTAVCCELLWNLSSKFGRFADLHSLLVYEMMQSMYHRFDDDDDINDDDVNEIDNSNNKLDHEDDEDHDRERRRRQQRQQQQWDVEHFLKKTPYYELIDGLQATVRKLRLSLRKLKKLRDEVETEATKRNKVFSMAIQAWQNQLMRRIFQNWSQATVMQKRTRQLLRLRRLRIWFDAFKKRWEQSKRMSIQKKYEETEKEREWQENRADGLLADKTQLEHDVSSKHKHIGTLETEIMERDATIQELKRKLLESNDRESRLTASCERLLSLQLSQNEEIIGQVPGLDTPQVSTAFGDIGNGQTVKKSPPFWTSLQDMSKLVSTNKENYCIEKSFKD